MNGRGKILMPPSRPPAPTLESMYKKRQHKVKIEINNVTRKNSIIIDGNEMNLIGEFKLEGIGNEKPKLTFTITDFELVN